VNDIGLIQEGDFTGFSRQEVDARPILR